MEGVVERPMAAKEASGNRGGGGAYAVGSARRLHDAWIAAAWRVCDDGVDWWQACLARDGSTHVSNPQCTATRLRRRASRAGYYRPAARRWFRHCPHRGQARRPCWRPRDRAARAGSAATAEQHRRGRVHGADRDGRWWRLSTGLDVNGLSVDPWDRKQRDGNRAIRLR